MCLYITTLTKKEIASKDITCYKVVLPHPHIKEAYITPYMSMGVGIGAEFKSNIVIEELHEITMTIEKALHSFVNLEDAILEYRNWVAYDASVIKCIIPKGSTYYKGRYEIENDSYASDCIKYVEKIDHLIVYNLLDILKDTWR